jgi:hypothetical protein
VGRLLDHGLFRAACQYQLAFLQQLPAQAMDRTSQHNQVLLNYLLQGQVQQTTQQVAALVGRAMSLPMVLDLVAPQALTHPYLLSITTLAMANEVSD